MKKESGLTVAVIFFGVTFGILNIGLLMSAIIWGVARLFGFHTSFFVIIEAFSAAVGAAAVFGAGFIAYKELKAMRNSQHLEGADKVFNEFNAEEKIKARRFVYQTFLRENPKRFDDLNEEELDAIKSVLNSLDRVAFLVYADQDWIPEEIVMPWMHPIIYKCWRSLKDYVQYEQVRRAEPFFYEHAQRLGEACMKWREKKGIPDAAKTLKEF